MDSLFLPKKQKPRRSAKQHVETVKEEVEKLKQAGAIKEVFFPKWLSNIVVDRKKNEKLRVCEIGLAPRFLLGPEDRSTG